MEYGGVMELKLPLSISSHADVTRLLREIEQLDDMGPAAKANSPAPMPGISYNLAQLARANSIDLLSSSNRGLLKQGLTAVLDQAPNLHITFAAEPSPEALSKILAWVRSSIHGQALLTVGLQPTIAAGCLFRTPNHLFDFSLQNFLKSQSDYLVKLIQEAANG